MDIQQIKFGLQAAGGDISRVNLGNQNLQNMLAAFHLPTVVGPVSVEGDNVIVSGSIENANITFTFSVEDGGDVTIEAELELPGPSADALKRFLPDFPIPLPATLTSETVQFGVSANGTLAMGVDLSGTVEALDFDASLKVQLTDGQPELDLYGSATCQIQGQPVTFSLSANLLPNGVIISGSMTGTLNFDVFQLSDVGLSVGIDDELIPSVGVSATINFQTVQGAVAIFFDSANPRQSMLAAAISEMTLSDAIQLFGRVPIPPEVQDALSQIGIEGSGGFQINAGSLVDHDIAGLANLFRFNGRSLPDSGKDVLLVGSQDGSRWFVTDRTTMRHYQAAVENGIATVSLEPQIYIAPQDTSIGTQQFRQGIRLAGKFHVAFLRVQDSLEIFRDRGFLMFAATDPIVFANVNFASITAQDDTEKGPVLSIATFDDPDLAPPGSPTAPYCVINGQAHLLGLSAGVLVNISSNGFEYSLHSDGFISYHIQCVIGRDGTFQGAGNVQMGGQHFDIGSLGQVHLPGVGFSVNASFVNQFASASFAFSFNLADVTFTKTVGIDVNLTPLADIDGYIRGLVTQIFHEALDGQLWTDLVRRGLIATGNAVGAVLRDVYQKGQDEVAAIMRQAGYTAQEVSDQLTAAFSLTGQAAKQVLEGVGFATEEAANAVGVAVEQTAEQAGQGLADAATAVGNTAVQAANEAVNTFGKLFGR